MKNLKLFIKSLIRPISSRLFFLILGIALSISFASVYAAWDTTVNSGDTLTSTLWNDHVNKLINLDGRVQSLETSGGASLGSCVTVLANYGDWAMCGAGYVVTGYWFNMGSDPAAGVRCCLLQ